MQPKRETIIPGQAPYIPMVKVHPSYIVGYYQYAGNRRKAWQSNLFQKLGVDQETGEFNDTKKAYLGEMSASAKKKLKAACELLFALAKKKTVTAQKTGKEFTFRIALITLTLSAPQGEITDRELKQELLEPFLRKFRAKGMFNYIWKAERQGNGNLHFHILTDSYQDKQKIKDYWNKLQAKLGFVESFHSKYGHRNPNSTDVKAVQSDKGMVNYMLKYMLKEVEKSNQLELGRSTEKKDTGKIWDCSLNLKLKNDTAEPLENEEYELIERACDLNKLKKIDCETCTVYVPVKGKVWNVAPGFLQRRILDYLKKVRELGRVEVERKKKK